MLLFVLEIGLTGLMSKYPYFQFWLLVYMQWKLNQFIQGIQNLTVVACQGQQNPSTWFDKNDANAIDKSNETNAGLTILIILQINISEFKFGVVNNNNFFDTD